MTAMFVNGSGQNEQSLERTFHRCFLPNFTSFGWGVSEKIKMWKVNGQRTPSDGKRSHCLWQGELTNGVLKYIACNTMLNTKMHQRKQSFDNMVKQHPTLKNNNNYKWK